MNWFDGFRVLVFLTFGVGCGFMLLTNWLAWRVLRNPSHSGFLWWHVSAISVATLCLGVVAVERVLWRLGTEATWQGSVILIGTSLFCVSQVIIYRVERKWCALLQAAEESTR